MVRLLNGLNAKIRTLGTFGFQLVIGSGKKSHRSQKGYPTYSRLDSRSLGSTMQKCHEGKTNNVEGTGGTV